MNRRRFLCNTLGSVSSAAWPRIARAAQSKGGGKPPNIVFVLADDLGWGDLGCYGHRDIKTPNLDRLAQQGALFTQFYVSAPVCGPSRTGFMTGVYPSRLGIHDFFSTPEVNEKKGVASFVDPSVPFVPRMLKQAGYATAHYGKWGFGNGPAAPKAAAYGIDNYIGADGQGGERDPYAHANSSDVILGNAMRFLEQHRDQPCFVNASLLLPHAILNPTEEQMKPYARFGPAGAPHKGTMQIYYASVTALDTSVGKLLAKLDELGIADDTGVIFSSDNGPEDIHLRDASHSGVGSAGPFRGGKRSLYEGGIRMPFLVRWPKHITAGRVDDNSVLTAVDFLPTLCRIAGVALPAGYKPDGEDVSDILLKQSRPRAKAIYWEWRWDVIGSVLNRNPRLVVREGNWKLLMNPDRSRVELYDIPKDPSAGVAAVPAAGLCGAAGGQQRLPLAAAEIAGNPTKKLEQWNVLPNRYFFRGTSFAAVLRRPGASRDDERLRSGERQHTQSVCDYRARP